MQFSIEIFEITLNSFKVVAKSNQSKGKFTKMHRSRVILSDCAISFLISDSKLFADAKCVALYIELQKYNWADKQISSR